MTTETARQLHIQVVSDMICPWCFIGKRSHDKALAILATQGVDVSIEWLPYQLNPTMPTEGMDRKAFRSIRFGSWKNACAMDARAVEAGSKVGADFQYERQTRTSSTVAAHRLVRLALADGGSPLQSRVVEALFVAYFTNGQDIGDRTVLDRIAEDAGMKSDAVTRSIALHDETCQLDEDARSSGLDGVPSYLVDDKLLFTGLQEVNEYVRRFAGAAT